MKLFAFLSAALFGLAMTHGVNAATAEEVIASNKCAKCHTATTTKKAPSYAAVATKYRGKADAVTVLFNGLKAGGKMGAEDDHAKLTASDEEIRAVVAFVLAAK